MWMAFPAAHCSLGWGIATLLGQRLNNPRQILFWSLLSISADFDFFFVFILGWSWHDYHRTFTHSIVFSLLLAGVVFLVAKGVESFGQGRGQGGDRKTMKGAGWWLAVFLILLSHVALDFLCVSNHYRDGEMLFWPFTYRRHGYQSFLVPLYRMVGGDPDSLLRVAFPYTILELILWSPVTIWVLWKQAATPVEQAKGHASAGRRPG